MDLVTKLALRPPLYYLLRRHSRGTLWYHTYDLLQNNTRERGCSPGRHTLRLKMYLLGRGRR